MNELQALIDFIEEEIEVEEVEFICKNFDDLVFTGWDDNDQEVEIIANIFNHIFVNGEYRQLNLPVNVYSIEL